MKVSLLITTLALCTIFRVSAQPFGVDTIDNMQEKKSSCVEMSEEKEEEIKIIVEKLTDHLHQVMLEHKDFDFKLIKLNIEEHKDTHTTENDTILQLIVNDCARENEDDTKPDEKLNINNITKAESKNYDEEVKKHDLSSAAETVGDKDTKPKHEINNQPTGLTKNNKPSSKFNDSLIPSFNHGEALPNKKPSMTKLTDSSKPLSDNHGPSLGKKPLPTDKKNTVLNGPKITNENRDKLKDAEKPLSNNHGPNFGIKPLATDKRDNVTNDIRKNNENADKLKDTIKPLSNNHGPDFGKQSVATQKRDNVTNVSKKDNKNTDKLKDTIKPLFNKDGAMPDKNKDSKPRAIDKKKDAIDGVTKKNDNKQNKTTEENNNEKETKITEKEPKLDKKNETHPEIKKNENIENVTKPKDDKKDEEQTKKPGPHKNETQADNKSVKTPKEDDNRDKKLTELKLPEDAEKLLRALEKNQPEGKPIWVYVGEKENKNNYVFF